MDLQTFVKINIEEPSHNSGRLEDLEDTVSTSVRAFGRLPEVLTEKREPLTKTDVYFIVKGYRALSEEEI